MLKNNNTIFALAGVVLASSCLAALAPLAPMAEASSSARAAQSGGSALTLLTPENSQLLLIDHQPQMLFGVQSHDRQAVRNNVEALAKAAKVFGIPTTLTTVASESFSGPLIPEIKSLHPKATIYDRTSMNTWDDKRVVEAVRSTGRPKIVLAALWTEVCATMPTLEAIRAGYDVYVVTDASGGTSIEAHNMAIERMVQAGAVPVTWQQVMLEWQRDWSRQDTYEAITGIAMQHSGAYGVGIEYAHSMFGGKEGGDH